MLTPASLVPGAPRQALPYGLFSVLSFRPEDADRWQGGGIKWEYIECNQELQRLQGVSAYSGGSQAIGLPKQLDNLNNPLVGQASPFTVFGYFNQSPMSWFDEERFQENATANLLAYEERRVENTIWNNSLLQPTGTLATVTLNNAHYGLAKLEGWLGEVYGSLGVIHMSRENASFLLTKGALTTKGGRLLTELGTPVVSGAGYGKEEIRATPPLFGYRSEIFTSSNRPGDLLDLKTNDLYAVAERTYLVATDPCGVAAITVTDPDLG